MGGPAAGALSPRDGRSISNDELPVIRDFTLAHQQFAPGMLEANAKQYDYSIPGRQNQNSLHLLAAGQSL